MQKSSTIEPLDYKVQSLNRGELRKAFASVQWQIKGKVLDVVGTVVEAHLPSSQLGAIAEIRPNDGSEPVASEVVGFRDDRALLLPFGHLHGISPGCIVSGRRIEDQLLLGQHLLGRVVDPFLAPLDGSAILAEARSSLFPIDRPAPNPMERSRVDRPLSLGIRAIDSLMTYGEGQRIGVMAGSGVGKSVLMGMMARWSSADVNVIGLIGERGREVREFIERDLGPQGIARSVVVVVTGDQSPLMRIRAAKVVTSIAEYFSSVGKNVLLMIDSLTRVAMAQREIGLAIGEPPTTKGYTPSVFSLLPRLLERSGPQHGDKGSISGIYTVLVDGDDFNDPIADATRAILDGHINLSRALASKGHFPAIDATTSSSRVMYDIASPEHWALANRLRSLLGTYQENFDLVQIGAYQPGANPLLDEAIARMPAINAFLTQEITEVSSFEDSIARLQALLESPIDAAANPPQVGA